MTITDDGSLDTGGTDDVDTDDDVDEEIDERPRFEWTWSKVIAVVVAFSFLAASAAYLVTKRDSGAHPNAVDVGFLQDMIDHHDQAVTMAMDVIGRPSDPTTQSFAREVVIYQRWETGVMDTLLAGWGDGRGDVARTAMAWMGMPSPVGAMPGMQSADAIQQLTTLTGKDLDKAFFTMMRDHHLGGVHMALYAARTREHEAGPRARGPDSAISTGGSERVHASTEATRPRELMTDVVLAGDGLSIDEIVAVARGGARAVLGDRARSAMQASRDIVEELASSGLPVYGVSTGFGSLADVYVEPASRARLQAALIRSHAAGMGAAVERRGRAGDDAAPCAHAGDGPQRRAAGARRPAARPARRRHHA